MPSPFSEMLFHLAGGRCPLFAYARLCARSAPPQVPSRRTAVGLGLFVRRLGAAVLSPLALRACSGDM